MLSFRKIMKYVWPQMRKFKGAFYAIIIVFSIRVVFDFILQPIYFKKIIDVISNSNNVLGSPDLSQKVFHLVFVIIGINVLVFIIARSIKFVYFKFEINVIRELRNFTFKKIESQSQMFFSKTFAGSLVTKSRRFVGAFETMFDILIYSFLHFIVLLTGVFVTLISQSVFISMVFIAWVIIHLTIVSLLVKQKVIYDQLEAEQDSRISGRLADVFGNILAVKFFSAGKREANYFSEYTDEGARRSTKAWFLGGRIDMIQHGLIIIVNGILLFLTTSLWLKNQMSTGTVVLIQTYMVVISQRIWDLGNSLTKFMKSASDMKEMVDIFEIIPDILDPEKPQKLVIKEGHIVFKNVDFRYNSSQDVLVNFNLEIKPGERIGVVGYSGAGKSTLTKLLLRFNDIDSGTITIDGQNIKDITQDDLRSTISYVPQEPILFHRSIKENIIYGAPDAIYDQMVDASRKAHAHDFIDKLAYKYDTKVGERGVKLSGGERQRVAIARAMLKNAPILVLDEATSSLDSLSESYIQEALQILMKGKTTIVIAHRLSTIQKMDRIIVLDNGKIVEEGNHSELISKNGIYTELWNHQSGGFIE